MRFLKMTRPADPAEDAAVGARLSAIIERSQTELCHYPHYPERRVARAIGEIRHDEFQLGPDAEIG
jgi:hypothetical protein